MQSRPSPAAPSDHVALPRRPFTEDVDETIELRSEDLLAMTDEQLFGMLIQLGISPSGDRDKMIETVMRVALSAQDS